MLKKSILLALFLCFSLYFISNAQLKTLELGDGSYIVNRNSELTSGTYKLTTNYPYAEIIIRSDVSGVKTKTIALTNGKIELPVKNALKEINLTLFYNDKLIISMPYGTVKFEPVEER
jgi:hypothetical protein